MIAMSLARAFSDNKEKLEDDIKLVQSLRHTIVVLSWLIMLSNDIEVVLQDLSENQAAVSNEECVGDFPNQK